MNLLILTNNLNRASFRLRIEVYLDTLQANGIDYEVAQLPSGNLARRKLFKKAATYDGVLLHKKKLNLMDAACLRRYSRKIIYNFDDAVMYSDKNPERYSRSHFVPFRRTIKLADLVITGSSYLAEHAQKFNPRVEVLPTGLNTRAYTVKRNLKTTAKSGLFGLAAKAHLSILPKSNQLLKNSALALTMLF